MRIAMITPGLLPVPAVKGGAVEVLIEYLIDGNEIYNNYDIDIYTVPDKKLNDYNYKYSHIIPVVVKRKTQMINKLVNMFYRCFRIKKWRTSFGRELVNIIKEQKYDLIVFHNNLMAYRDIYEKTNNKNNLVYVIHNNVNDGDENHVIIGELIGKTAKKVLAVSEYTMNNFKEISECANIDVLYNCIDIDRYSVRISEEHKNDIRRDYRIEDSDFVFIYSGRIDVYKGVLELVQAFKKINRENTKLLIVGASWFNERDGNDKYFDKLKEETETVKENIVFTGFVKPEKMPEIYQIADCLVVPSMWEEPFGVVALEGMASKLPLIVTNSGGLVEIVDDKCAFIVNKEDIVNELSTKMYEILKDSALAKNMGEAGYRKICGVKEYNKDNYYQTFCCKI